MFNLRSLKKKFLATCAAAAVGFSLTFGTPAVASASLLEDVIVVGINSAALSAQINDSIKHYNKTEAGQKELFSAFREKYGVNEDPTYNAILDRVMANLTKGVAMIDPTVKDKPYKYFISNDESLNAACGMGHVMMVNVGTFKVIPNEDELAAIVGHEMGHGQKDHAAKGQKKYLKKYIIANAAGLAVGATIGGGAITSAITSIAFQHSVAHGDRKQESEADTLGFDYIINTDYNPGACAAVMQKFVEMEQGQKRSAIAKFFNPSDHPDSDKRRDAYVKKLFEYSGKHVTAKDAVITVNNKTLTKVAAADNMSAAERSYFVLGNLATAYHRGQDKYGATVENGIVMMGNQPIIAPAAGDEDAYTIAERLNAIK